MGIFLFHTHTSNEYLLGGYTGDGYPLPSLDAEEKGYKMEINEKKKKHVYN
jgi:hypothetical protein